MREDELNPKSGVEIWSHESRLMISASIHHVLPITNVFGEEYPLSSVVSIKPSPPTHSSFKEPSLMVKRLYTLYTSPPSLQFICYNQSIHIIVSPLFSSLIARTLTTNNLYW